MFTSRLNCWFVHVACSQMWMSVHWAMTSVIRLATTPLAATHAAVTLDTPLMSMVADVMVCGYVITA